jgi:hypothetical protein
MKKNYFLFALLCLFSATSMGQIVATDDNLVAITCGPNTQFLGDLLFTNDTLNGVALTQPPILTIVPDQGNINGIYYDTTNNTVSFNDTYGISYTINMATGQISAINMNFSVFSSSYFAYQICDPNNTSNCDIGYVYINMQPQEDIPYDDDFTAYPIANDTGGITPSVLQNDFYGCSGATYVSGFNLPAGITIDAFSGEISVAIGTIPGTYSIQYELSSGYTAYAIVLVTGPSTVVANYDNYSPVYAGTTTFSVLNNDLFNGVSIPNGAVAITPLNSISGFTLNADGTISIAASVLEGVYNLPYQICTSTGMLSCSVNYAHITVLKNAVVGTVRYDSNANGCDTSDPTLAGIKIVNQNNGTTYTTYSFYDGTYRSIADQGVNTISAVLPSYFTVNPSVLTYNFTAAGITDNGDFCISANSSVDDLEIVAIPLSNVVPGLPISYVLAYKNKGTTILSGQINFQYNPSKMSFWTSTPAPDGNAASTLTYNFTNLQPFEIRVIRPVKFHVLTPPTVNAGDSVSFASAITPVANDLTPLDNSSSVTQVVVNSLDPNDMLVHEGSTITLSQASNYLHYTIHFQNLGSSEAINIKIDNDVEAKLDWTTFELVSSSHPCIVKNKDNHNEFLFEGIYLPGSNDVDNSTGYVSYKIKPKSNVVVGDVLTNQALIYFDYNDPIATNTTSTAIVGNLNTTSFDSKNTKVYPNPVVDKLHISNDQIITEIEIYSVLGQKMLSKKVDALEVDVDMTNYPEGFYCVSIKGSNGVGNYKVLKAN